MASHEALLKSRWFFDWYLSNPVRSKLHAIVLKKLRQNLHLLVWDADVDPATGTYLSVMGAADNINLSTNAKYESALLDILITFGAAASQIELAVSPLQLEGCKDDKERLTQALERQLRLSPMWSVTLDFYRGTQLSPPVSIRNNRQYFVDGIVVLLEKATTDIRGILLDETVLNVLFPQTVSSATSGQVVTYPVMLPHEQYLIKKDFRACQMILRVMRAVPLAFGLLPIDATQDEDDDSALVRSPDRMEFGRADTAEMTEAEDWITYQWTREVRPTLLRMVAFLAAVDFRQVALAFVVSFCKAHGNSSQISSDIRTYIEPYFSQADAAKIDRTLPTW